MSLQDSSDGSGESAIKKMPVRSVNKRLKRNSSELTLAEVRSLAFFVDVVKKCAVAGDFWQTKRGEKERLRKK